MQFVSLQPCASPGLSREVCCSPSLHAQCPVDIEGARPQQESGTGTRRGGLGQLVTHGRVARRQAVSHGGVSGSLASRQGRASHLLVRGVIAAIIARPNHSKSNQVIDFTAIGYVFYR